jgi:hypothetical protein
MTAPVVQIPDKAEQKRYMMQSSFPVNRRRIIDLMRTNSFGLIANRRKLQNDEFVSNTPAQEGGDGSSSIQSGIVAT